MTRLQIKSTLLLLLFSIHFYAQEYSGSGEDINKIIENTAILFIPNSLKHKKNPRYSEKATPTAAIDAVLITATADHPYK